MPLSFIRKSSRLAESRFAGGSAFFVRPLCMFQDSSKNRSGWLRAVVFASGAYPVVVIAASGILHYDIKGHPGMAILLCYGFVGCILALSFGLLYLLTMRRFHLAICALIFLLLNILAGSFYLPKIPFG